MVDIKGYNCPNCNGIIQFDISTQTAKCRSCGAAFGRAELASYQWGNEDIFDCAGGGDEDIFDCAPAAGAQPLGSADVGALGDEDTFDCAAASAEQPQETVWETKWDGEVWEDPESDDLTTGACPSCGAELYGCKTTIAMVCPCCGNAQIVAKRLQGILKPDSVIPFKYDKNTAVEALENFCAKRKRLLPARFVKENRLDAIQGVYAPFWLFDLDVEGYIEYEATKKVKRGKHYVTIYYCVEREGGVLFKKIPVDGSQKMDDDYMDAIEPFDYCQLTDFHPSYLAGYTAEKYDVDALKSRGRALYRMETTVEKMFRKTVHGYNTVTVVESDINVKKGNMSYALLPVWTVNTKYDGDDYLFMMNGQTGKMVGRLPVDNGKAWMWRGILTGGFWALLTPILYYLNMEGILGFVTVFILAAGLALIGIKWPWDLSLDVPLPVIIMLSIVFSALGAFWILRRWIYNMDTAREQTEASDYVVPGSFELWVESDERI